MPSKGAIVGRARGLELRHVGKVRPVLRLKVVVGRESYLQPLHAPAHDLALAAPASFTIRAPLAARARETMKASYLGREAPRGPRHRLLSALAATSNVRPCKDA